MDEDNLEQEDLESILDDCLALSMPSRHLLWHYRSKHESLIAFSNAKYYDNSLLTFPSTDDLATKVRYVHVPGFYDKGKTRQNRAEAVAIVGEIMRRLGGPALRQRSMGVVTFSVVQQNLIEDLLTEEFRKFPELEKTALESAEPLFIKNLENVQGDERDVILFSICYGPDAAGKVSLNFGPLNREGGWRRLNVAVSRARYKMMVFATLRADGIDLSRTAAVGVAGLRDFLAFAEKGKAALPGRALAAGGATDRLVEIVADAIRAKGYEVHLNIGCSGYRVDTAVVNPQKPHEYVLGILMDSPAYGAARTARDREVVQPGVLRSLGWTLHRIWSLAWWEAPEKVLAGALEAIEAALIPAVPLPEIMESPATETFPEMLVADHAEAVPVTFAAGMQGRPTVGKRYVVSSLAPVAGATAESFLEARNRPRIQAQVREVLETEAPVSKALLCRQVLSAWGVGRAGARLTAHLDDILRAMAVRQTISGKRIFLWKEGQDPKAYNAYRLPADEADKREAEDLPPEEVAACAHEILSQQLSLPRAELIRECARQLHYNRLGSKVEEAIGAGVDWAVTNGRAVEKEGRMVGS